jgi:hypothetical protein
MNPRDAWLYREKYMKKIEEKEKGEQSPDLENVLTEIFINTCLQEVDEDIDIRKTLKWKSLKKFAKHLKVHEMKKYIEKWLGREKSDIRKKIISRRQQLIRKLKEHQKLIKEVKQIKEKNEKDVKFLPLLEEAIESNRLLSNINYKNHINRVLETRLNIFWKKLIRENREGKKRIQLMIKEANHEKA